MSRGRCSMRCSRKSDPSSTHGQGQASLPTILYLSAGIEGKEGTYHFDTGRATEAKSLDGMIVSTDRIFDGLRGLRTIWRSGRPLDRSLYYRGYERATGPPLAISFVQSA